MDIQVISYDYDQLQNVEIVKGIYQKCEVLGIVGTKNPQIGQEKFIPLEQLVSGAATEQMINMLKNVADAVSMEKLNDNFNTKIFFYEPFIRIFDNFRHGKNF